MQFWKANALNVIKKRSPTVTKMVVVTDNLEEVDVEDDTESEYDTTTYTHCHEISKHNNSYIIIYS